MPNLTIAIESSLLRAAQEYAAKRGTTLSHLIQTHLTELIDIDRQDAPNRLNNYEWRCEEKPVMMQNHSERNVSTAFRFVEEPNMSSPQPPPTEEPLPLDNKPELSVQQVEQKMAEIFKQMLNNR